MAKDVKFLISASADNAVAEMKKMQANGEDVSKLMGYAFQRLGTTSDTVFDKQKESARTAYALIKNSGVTSAADIERAYTAMQAKLAGIDKTASLENIGRGAKESAKDVSGLSGHIDALSSSLMSLAGPAAMGLLIRSSISAALATEKYTAAMAASTGSSQAAAREIQFIREESNRLGLDFVATAGAFAKFTASTRNTSIEGEATRKIFIGVSEAVTAMKLSGDDANGIFLALSQMMSKGKVSAEELNGQLGERLPGALKLTADAMGMTTAELMKQMEQGKLMSSDVLPKLADQLHKTYGEAAKKAAEGGQSAINRFNNEVKATAASIGSALMPAMNAMATKATAILRDLREAPPGWISTLGYAVSPSLTRLVRSGSSKTPPVSSSKTAADLAIENAKTDVAKASEQAVRDKAAAETQKKEMEKQKNDAVVAFRDKARVIIDIEKERVRTTLAIEKEYGASLKAQYEERITDLVAFSKARDAVSESKAARDKKRAEDQAAAARGPEDAYQKYYRTREELAQAEADLDNESSWSPAAIAQKLKAYDDLIKKSEEQAEQASTNSIESISSEQAAYDARENRIRLETKIEELGKRQLDLMESSAIAAVEESVAWQSRISATEDRVKSLDQMLQNLPRVKEIAVNLTVNGLADLQQVTGMVQGTSTTVSGLSTVSASGMSASDYYESAGSMYWGDGTYAGSSFASGTDYVPATGIYLLHKGEEVKNTARVTSESKTTNNAASYNFSGNIIMPNVTNQTTARELFTEFQKLARRQAA